MCNKLLRHPWPCFKNGWLKRSGRSSSVQQHVAPVVLGMQEHQGLRASPAALLWRCQPGAAIYHDYGKMPQPGILPVGSWLKMEAFVSLPVCAAA